MIRAIRRIELPQALAVLALLAGGVLLVVWLGELTFWRDEWAFLLHRRGFSADVFLQPHYEHIAVGLVASYKLLLAIFGMDSPRPFQLVAITAFIASLALVFVYVRRRVGDWLALAAILPILVLGPAWDDLLWPFQLGFFGTMTAGLGAMLALERGDRAGDIAATVLLVIAISFSSLGVPFAIGAAVAVAVAPGSWSRAYVALVPLAFYGLWWLGWGHDADSYLSLQNLATLPGYVADGFASSLASLLGLANPSSVVASPLDWGRALLVAAVALAVWRLRRAGRISSSLLVVLTVAVSFWALAGLNASIFREPTSGRYQYMGAIFIVLIAAEILRGVRPRPPAIAIALGVALLAALGNVQSLHTAWRGLTGFGQAQPAGLAALELVRANVDPAFELTEQNSGVDYLGELDAGSYFSAVDAFGSPAFTPQELAAAPEVARGDADRVFAAALGVGLIPSDASVAAGPGCQELTLERGPQPVPLPANAATVAMASPGTATVTLRRYASETFPVALGTVTRETPAAVAIERDASTEPWELGLSGTGTVRVCGGEP